MKFSLKKMDELCEKDFELSRIWAKYYEPDDANSLVNLGYKLEDIQSELKRVNYSDEYAFPIPICSTNESFHYIFYAINAKLACGKILKGYCSSRRAFAIALFFNDKIYSFNLNLRDMALIEEEKLKKALKISKNIFPIRIEIVALNETGNFTFE